MKAAYEATALTLFESALLIITPADSLIKPKSKGFKLA